ncbi:isopenicillin N synthase family dioxygenase [Rheinheimera tangshanensis]|uniref:2-oxoglutarate-dependent ethylene/succinate-forming enzyme n=1 Tax=Rheinheimera tangshanensis TaxID=400153 RepID=A0A5C8LUX4_9GAMM|nr:2-oxoglutarate and iron-dependent oxygenase domain-containing protein [Rheinheimera tangshanensis]TXK81076.1 isopenicillin N synthase family oxygenase [Rheinheimera tangshanensis]GGM57862.1 2-oxobutyrate oxidase [Rheinheimera tangshanensis]
MLHSTQEFLSGNATPEASRALPVLDLSLMDGTAVEQQSFIQQLRVAARDVGFFYLTGHGQTQQKQQQILALTKQFFALPLTDKQQVQMIHSPHFRGYTGLGGELTRGQPDIREQFDVMREEEVPAQTDISPAWQGLIGPNQWPTALPQMKTELLNWQQSLSDTTVKLMRALMLALQQPADALDDTIKAGPYQHMKLIRYPGVDAKASNSKQGVGAHKDPGYLTLVVQDDQSGLEVETEQGWVSVAPLPGAFVVNIGELLELASNGYLKATLHRVVSPNSGVERYSCAFFMAAQLDATVPLLQLPSHLADEAKGPASDPTNPLFYQVGQNVLKGRLRSHRDVAAAHYAVLAKAV